MPDASPDGKWIIVRDIKADPGGCMAVIEREVYRAPCIAHNPGVPVYSREELGMIKRIPHSAEVFRSMQRIKKAFPSSRIVHSDTTNQTPNG